MQDHDGDKAGGNGAGARRGILAWAVQISAIVCIGALALTHYLARVTGPHEAALSDAGRPRLARTQAEPETTGALGTLRGTRLDPCGTR